ncbi:MAG TPA: hypothetical protein DF613_05240, partial [Lachnospiraceae bacterium]|nr:hypothetical protein [Lachnospiraceae bacterium]
AAKKIKSVPAQGTISKLTAGKKTATVKLKKQSGVSGYEIYSAAGKKGTYKKAKAIKTSASLDVIITKLKSGKTYYFKTRAYKTVGKKKVYGAWSAIKQVKIK